MISKPDAREVREEDPTCRFSEEQLESLKARSVEGSVMSEASLEGASFEAITAQYPAATPPCSSLPELLGERPASLSPRRRRWVKRRASAS